SINYATSGTTVVGGVGDKRGRYLLTRFGQGKRMVLVHPWTSLRYPSGFFANVAMLDTPTSRIFTVLACAKVSMFPSRMVRKRIWTSKYFQPCVGYFLFLLRP